MNEAYQPEELVISIGGYSGPSYRISWGIGHLEYQAADHGSSFYAPHELIEPTSDEWQRFWAALDAIRIWSWEDRYDDPHILDGTHWEINIVYNGKRITASGSNAYPEGNGFTRFCKAVRMLIGKRKFG